ncbi:MAG: carbohydrate kinase family protein [Candidatus Falkowbacteria bacterium]
MILNKKFDLITIGGSTEDISMYIEDYHLIANRESASGNPFLAFDYGTKVGVKESFITFGGGASNTAVTASKLGLKVGAMVTYGSDDRGQRIMANLKKNKVNVSMAKKIRGQSSGFSFIVIGENKEHVVFSCREANTSLEVLKKDLSTLNSSKWLFVTSMTGDWRPDMDNIIKVDKSVKIAWNPGEVQITEGYKAWKKYLPKMEVLTMNKDEAIKMIISHPDYANSPYDFLLSSVNLLKVIKGWGPKIVVITNGVHGADAYNGRGFFFQPVIESKTKADTTGLGDTFGASFVSGLELFDYDIKKSLHLAAWNASSKISQLGAQSGLLDAEDIRPLFFRKKPMPKIETKDKK